MTSENRDCADATLTSVIVDATRAAIEQLRAENPDECFCVYALVTVGEAFRPYLAVTLAGDGRWDLGEGPFAVAYDQWLAQTGPAFDARGQLYEMPDDEAAAEYDLRLGSMEAALRVLDDEGLFGSGPERDQVLLLVATMPPDDSDASFARRLNPSGPLLDAWLAEAAEGR